MPVEVDEQGIIRSGRFAGHHYSNVADYAETLEETVKQAASPAPAAPNPPSSSNVPARPTPEQTLQQQAGPRVASVEMLTAQRLELDDEAQFAAMVSDYLAPLPNTDPPITMRQAVWKLKDALPVAQRIAKGIHAQLYAMVKQQVDAKVQAAIFGTQQKPAPTTDDDEDADQDGEAPEPASAPVSAPAAPPPTREQPAAPVRQTPKAVSPVASPTPQRAAPDRVKKPKLQASDKLAKMARTMGKDLNSYLLELETAGYTQADVDRMAEARPAQSQRRSTVYDRA